MLTKASIIGIWLFRAAPKMILKHNEQAKIKIKPQRSDSIKNFACLEVEKRMPFMKPNVDNATKSDMMNE